MNNPPNLSSSKNNQANFNHDKWQNSASAINGTNALKITPSAFSTDVTTNASATTSANASATTSANANSVVNATHANTANIIEFYGPKSSAPLIAKLAMRAVERDEFTEKSPLAADSELKELESNPQIAQKNIIEAIKKVNSQELEQNRETLAHSRSEIICDRDHIEGQRIDVIGRKDLGLTEFRFKLRNPIEKITNLTSELDAAREKGIKEIITKSGAILSRDKIDYKGKSIEDGLDTSFTLCDASVFEKDGVKVFIADPASRRNCADDICAMENHNKFIRTALGLIKAEVPSNIEPELVEQSLRTILEEDLSIPSALSEVTRESEHNYKTARYKWQHVIDGELTPEQIAKADALEYEEVFPGYTTLVEKGKHKEYIEQYGDEARATHLLYSESFKSIYRVLTQGLMSTTERFSRGVIRSGMSSATDIDTGGADSVFTRITNSNHRKQIHGNLVVLKPEIFDRTDWYAYDSDNYGSTHEENFANRVTPEEAIAEVSNGEDIVCSNEQMFRTGIGANFIESIIVSPGNRNKYINWLKEKGMEKFDGRDIEDVIISRESFADKDDDFDDFDDTPDTPKQSYKDTIKAQMAEARKDINALIEGQKPYTSIDEIADLASTTDDFNKTFSNIINALIEQGKKEQLSNDIKNYIMGEMTQNELKTVALGAWPDGYLESDKQNILFLQNELGVDYKALYEESLH